MTETRIVARINARLVVIGHGHGLVRSDVLAVRLLLAQQGCHEHEGDDAVRAAEVVG